MQKLKTSTSQISLLQADTLPAPMTAITHVATGTQALHPDVYLSDEHDMSIMMHNTLLQAASWHVWKVCHRIKQSQATGNTNVRIHVIL